LVLKRLKITKIVQICGIFFKILLVIPRPADNTTENTQSYCLTFIPHWSL